MNDKQEILQTIIDSNQLDKYFHVDVLPQRIPLRIVKGNWYQEDIRLTKFNQPVQFISSEDLSEPYLAVMVLKITEGVANVSFRYPPEGIVGDVKLEKGKMQWMISSISIHEQ